MSNQRAIDIVSMHEDATKASEALVKASMELWAINEAGGRDDITALVIFLPLLPGQVESDPAVEHHTPQLSPTNMDEIHLGPEQTPSPVHLGRELFATPKGSPVVEGWHEDPPTPLSLLECAQSPSN